MAEAPSTTLCLINFNSSIYDVTGKSTVTNSGATITSDQTMHDTSTGYFNYQNKNYCKIDLSEAAQTITFWFYATGSNTANWYPTLFSTNSGSNNSGGVYTHIDDGSYSTYPVFRANSATSTQANNGTYGSSVVTRNTWHHFACCKNGTNFLYFIDGTKCATVSQSGPPDITTVIIGAHMATPNGVTSGTYFSGYIDNVLITSDCLYTDDFTVPSEEWTYSNEVTQPIEPLSKQDTTNYGTYSGSIANLTDGDTSTYWWTNGAQSAGNFVQFEFNRPIIFNGLTAVTLNNTGDCIHSGTVLQTSVDGTTWNTVGNFTGEATCTFENLNIKNIKYIRIYVETDSNKWLCVNEITLDYEEYYPLKIKQNGQFIGVKAVYKKSNNKWTQVTDYANIFSTDKMYIKKN